MAVSINLFLADVVPADPFVQPGPTQTTTPTQHIGHDESSEPPTVSLRSIHCHQNGTNIEQSARSAAGMAPAFGAQARGTRVSATAAPYTPQVQATTPITTQAEVAPAVATPEMPVSDPVIVVESCLTIFLVC